MAEASNAQSAKKLLKSTGIVSSMTLISRLLGFLREAVLAYAFGASGGMDAFIIAFKLPNFMRRLFAEGAFSQAFVPVLSEYRATRTPQEIQTFVNHVFGNLTLVLVAVVLLAIIGAPLLVHIFAPGFGANSSRFELATQMVRITFPYLLFISLTAFGGAILNTYSRFIVPAITPVLLNLVLITAALIAAFYFHAPILALAWGVLAAGILQLLLQLPFLKHLSLLPYPKPNWTDPGVKRILKLMIPALFGVSVAQLSVLIDSVFASFLKVGSVSWLYYSDRLTYLPLGVFGVAIATVVLPHLSRMHAEQNKVHYSNTIDWALKSVLLVGIPSALGLLILARPILATLLQHGEFTIYDVEMTAQSVMAFALGIPAFMLVKVLASAFYARQDIKAPVKIAVISLIVNMILNVVLIFPLAHAGLALATTLASFLNAGLLLYKLSQQKVYIPSRSWIALAGRLLLANGVLCAVLVLTYEPLSVWAAWSVPTRFLALSWRIALGILCYIAALRASGFRLSRLWIMEENCS